MAPGGLPLIDDLPKAVLAALLAAAGTLALWGALDRRSPGAALARRACRLSGGPGRILLGVLAAAVLFVVAEDVSTREGDELILHLDRQARELALGVAAAPAVRRAAYLVSEVTGLGLVVIVGATAIGLAAARRFREAAILLGGSLGAWLLAAGLKLAFAIGRPNPRPVRYAITGYGFPSAHVLVALVAFGLLAWAVGLGSSPRVRFALYGAAGLVTLSAAAARLILDRHWLSDVVAGLVVGALWLNLVTLAATLSWITRPKETP